MTDYAYRALQEINPCGIAGKPTTQCKYAPDCAALGRQESKFLCLPQMAYQVAKYLIQGSNVETERRDLRDHITGLIGITVIDPKQTPLLRTKLSRADIEKVIEETLTRGEELSKRAISVGGFNDSLNFLRSQGEMVEDLF